MASISSSIELYDKISAPVNRIIGALNNMVGIFESVDSAMDSGFDPSVIDATRREIDLASAEMNQLGQEILKSKDKQENFNKEVSSGTNAMGGLVQKAMGLAGAYMSIQSVTNFISEAIEGSNLETSINAQLKNVLKNVGAAQNAFEELQEASQGFEANGMYGATEMMAGAGELATYISDTDAIKSMMGTLANYSAGMSGGGALSSDQIVEYGTQLGKALMGTYDGLAKKGFELTDVQKDIIDGTASHQQIAAELGLSIEEVASMSEDMHKALVLDSVISESWGGLYDTMSNTPEGQVSMLQNAWGDVMDTVGHQLTPSVMTLFGAIQKNMPMIKQMILTVTNVLSGGINVIAFLVENLSLISPVLMGIIAALGIYATIMAVVTAINAANAFVEGVKAAAVAMSTGATFAATAAQYGLNAALWACPITWIIAAIIVVIALIIGVIIVINKLTGSTTSSMSVICGVLATAFAVIWNLFLVLFECIIGYVNQVVNPWIAFANFFANLFKDPIGSIIHLFGDFADIILGIVEKMARAMDFVFGTNLADRVKDFRKTNDEFINYLADKYGNGQYEEVVGKLDLSTEDLGLERWAYEDAWNSGVEFGEDIENAIDNFDLAKMTDDLASGLYTDVGDISDNTGETADALSVTNEDLKYLRDLAERDVINRFTTAEIKVDMTNNNNISSGMDLDGVVEYLVVGVNEAMEKAAEGVYA